MTTTAARKKTKPAAKKPAAKKPAAKKPPAKRTPASAPAERATATAATAATATAERATATATTAAGPKSKLTPGTIPNDKPYAFGMFTRAGCFALASPTKAAWANPHENRVGWLDLDDGTWRDFFSKKYARAVGADGDTLVCTAKTGKNQEFVVVDPARGKKPVRYPATAEDFVAIAFSPSTVLTLQDEAKSGEPRVHVWDRATFKLQKIVPSQWADPAAVSPSAAAIVARRVNGENVSAGSAVELWTAPWQKPRVVETGFEGWQPIKALGFSGDGSRVAAASVDAVVVIDVATAKIVARIETAARGKKIKTPLRAEHNSRTWLRPLPHDQLLVIDFARDVGCHELAIELWNVGAGARVAVEVVTLVEGKGQGLAEGIAVSDDVIVLNRDRLVRLS